MVRQEIAPISAYFTIFLTLLGVPGNGAMADLLGAGSNHIAEILKDWTAILKQSSLGHGQAQNSNEREDGSAPRVSRPAVGRRRKTA